MHLFLPGLGEGRSYDITVTFRAEVALQASRLPKPLSHYY